jgi:hypothetical protein
MPQPKALPVTQPNASPPTAERRRDAAIEQTFPASDPVADGSARGTRAVDPAELAPREAEPRADTIEVSRVFADGEIAKLALEAIVREGPIDRRLADITAGGSGSELRIAAKPGDAARLQALLDVAGG